MELGGAAGITTQLNPHRISERQITWNECPKVVFHMFFSDCVDHIKKYVVWPKNYNRVIIISAYLWFTGFVWRHKFHFIHRVVIVSHYSKVIVASHSETVAWKQNKIWPINWPAYQFHWLRCLMSRVFLLIEHLQSYLFTSTNYRTIWI